MIRIVTDSTVNITKSEAGKMGLTVLPMGYTVDNQPYLESYTDCNGQFEPLLQSRNFTTNQVSTESFVSAFSEIARKGDETLCIVISSRLSGTYRNAFSAAEQVNRYYGGEKVLVLDSFSTAGAMLLLCRRALELSKTVSSLHELAERMQQERAKPGVVFSLDSMDALRRSGRIGIVRQSVSTILNIRPVLRCQDGAVISLGTARGRTEQMKKLIDAMSNNPKQIVVNASQKLQQEQLFQQLLVHLRERFPKAQIAAHGVGPILSHHLGRGAIGISWMEE